MSSIALLTAKARSVTGSSRSCMTRGHRRCRRWWSTSSRNCPQKMDCASPECGMRARSCLIDDMMTMPSCPSTTRSDTSWAMGTFLDVLYFCWLVFRDRETRMTMPRRRLGAVGLGATDKGHIDRCRACSCGGRWRRARNGAVLVGNSASRGIVSSTRYRSSRVRRRAQNWSEVAKHVARLSNCFKVRYGVPEVQGP